MLMIRSLAMSDGLYVQYGCGFSAPAGWMNFDASPTLRFERSPIGFLYTRNSERFPRNVRVILQGLKTYGMLLADNGGDWFVTGAPDPRWDDDELHTLKQIKGSDFEAVQTGQIVKR